jgi:hypothetical protein
LSRLITFEIPIWSGAMGSCVIIYDNFFGKGIGPTNISPGSTWRIRSYSDAEKSRVAYDSGVRAVCEEQCDADIRPWLRWESF